MNSLVALPVLLPLLGAALALAGSGRRRVQESVAAITLASVAAVSVVLLVDVDGGTALRTQAGGWAAPVGIGLVVDRFAAVMLVVSSMVLLLVHLYASGQGDRAEQHPAFHPAYLVLAAGVGLCFVTGDLFNLFVAFELMLASSYVLITLGGRPDQIRAGMTYVVISLIASTLFLTTVAFVYAATGTVDMAQIAVRLAELPDGVQTALALLLFLVLGVKAAVFPLFSWLPDSYPTAPGPITALFAGLLTKVGVYAVMRTQLGLFSDGVRPTTVVLTVGAATMVVGVLGAIAQDDVKRILSFHIVSQIGYMVMGLGFFTVAGVAGAIFFLVNNILLKTALLLVAGLIERSGGSARLSHVGGMVRSAPGLAVLFALPALSLAGVPPFGGFVAKLGLAQAGLDDGRQVVVAISLAVSLLTLYSMAKIWAGAFWGEPEVPPVGLPVDPRRWGGPVGMVLPTALVVGAGVAAAVFAGPLWDLSTRTAVDLLGRGAP